MDTLISLLKEFGLPVVLVLFFVWRDWKREQSMAAKIGVLETEMRDVLFSIVRDATVTMSKNSDVLTNLIRVLERVPCLSKGFCALANSQGKESDANKAG